MGRGDVCRERAKYVEDESIIGVIGTFNSGCAKIEVPIANEASLAVVSPANTATGLTHEGPGAESGEPDKYYPSGVRNYARVVTSDDIQGAIGAQYMQETLGCTSMYILDDKDAYGKGVADAFESAAGTSTSRSRAMRAGTRTRRTTSPCSRRSRPRARTASTSAASPASTAAS